jgi:uncharacterized protein (TIGR02145 family)
MKTILFFIIMFSAACMVNAINISGVVKGSGGGLDGVMVRLGKAGLATTTGPDGSFALKDNTTGAEFQTIHAASRGNCPFVLNGNMLLCKGPEQPEVMAFDCTGKLLFSRRAAVSKGNRSMALPHFGSGVYFYRIALHGAPYVFRRLASPAAKTASGPTAVGISCAERLAKSTARIDDALLFTKEGFQLFRVAITKSDTSGLQITMTARTTGTIKDGEGNEYRTVRIGNQEWTAENLRATKLNDGTGIALVTDKSAWGGASSAACCFYNNTTDAAARKKWGALYNFAAVKTGKLAPSGWHAATNADWDTLESYLTAKGYNFDGTLSGNKVAKSLATTTFWEADTDDTGAIGFDLGTNNASGFSAVPGGYRYYDGAFNNQGNMCFFWTATEKDGSYAWFRYLWSVNPDLYKSYRVKFIGCYVRLVRNN